MSVLELQLVSKSFGGVRAVDRVSMGFEEGRITGLIGPNGAGKTTLFNLICGFIRPDEGIIQCRGEIVNRRPPWRIAQMGVGRLFQDVHLFSRLRVIDNVMVAIRPQPGENPLFSVALRWKAISGERSNRDRAMKLLDFVGLADNADDLAEDLSYGQQKLLSIARLLAAEADVLLLDEPTAGVSPQTVGRLLGVLRQLARDGKTVVFIEHNMNVVIEVADLVYFLDNGQFASFGTPADVLGDPEIRKAYIGV